VSRVRSGRISAIAADSTGTARRISAGGAFVTALGPVGNLAGATFEPLVEALMETLGGRFSLGWTHYVTLLTVTNPEARRFYEIEATSNGWGTRELERQIASSLYERLALSRDKEEIRKLAEQGLVVAQAADIIKNPYVLEFLDLQEHSTYSERELETAIIGKLEQFLLELGKGFLFEARQKRFTFDNDHFYVDLVFYNRLLHCYVLLDLKLDKLTHQDLGQMQMYVNYFDRHVKTAEEAPTIGILLCRRKSDALVELTLPEGREHSRVRIPALPTLERGTTEKTHGLDQGVGNMTDRRLISAAACLRTAFLWRRSAQEMDSGLLWPDPLVQLNPSFATGETLQQLVDNDTLHPECLRIFRDKREDGSVGAPFQLHRHQIEGILAACAGDSYVLTTGTGSGKSLSYIVPIVDHVLRRGSGKGIQAIIVYPMNALANSQMGELEKFLSRGYPAGRSPVTYRSYTGQESDAERKEIIASPPDILLTNYVMLELVLTRPWDYQLVEAAKGLRFLVLDELHTYRGRQGADVAMLARRLREGCDAEDLLHVGTSATLAGGGTWAEQQAEVASLASRLFGVDVKPDRVIGETLTRATRATAIAEPEFLERLRTRLQSNEPIPPGNTEAFLVDPLSIWIESTLGVREEERSGRLLRCTPRSLSGDDGVAALLEQLTGVDGGVCEAKLREVLLSAYLCRDANGHPLFAFRLHQFVSKGDSVCASPEPETVRHITLQAQQFVPGSGRAKVLLPIAFCRECGQEYYSVRRGRDLDGRPLYVERSISDRLDNDDGEAGYLYISAQAPWPDDANDFIPRLPDTWLETSRDGLVTVRKSQRKNLPRKVFISSAAIEGEGDQLAWWLPAPFRFCLHCGVTYNPRQQSDFGKLATLGSEGRSTATTVMTLSTIRCLRGDDDLVRKAQKLLSFTDNRQDASLQAGHFNDFIEIALLRSALWRAVEHAGSDGIRHDRLTLRVFEALDLPVHLYAADPGVKYAAREETQRALREVLGYYVYRDLRRGWRITSPNLEQCGLLEIDYLSIGEFCAAQDEWEDCHPALTSASAEDREHICRVLLDFMRRELGIRVSFLDPIDQESIRQLSRQRLTDPWALEDNENLERSRIVFPRSRANASSESGHFVYLSPRGGLGQFLKRPDILPHWPDPLKLDDVADMVVQLCEKLTIPGLVHRALDPREDGEVGGYQLNASALIWRQGAGAAGFHDPIRVPCTPEEGLRTNPFFTDFYRRPTDDMRNLEAREHTAQVQNDIRKEREERFRSADLPILYCSPTMELGVDISQLNVVNMRNVPPTPANYAQRSGRAGRSGQPAFVFSYCSAGSPHDQYFFKRPQDMVAGSVTRPRLDLGNEDLIRAHVHAIWLGTSKLSLGKSLRDVLEVSGDTPTLGLLPKVSEALHDLGARERARARAQAALGEAIVELVEPGDPDEWLDRVIRELPSSFDGACRRWRGLYLAALSQSKRQQRIILDPSRDPKDRESAKRLRAEAEAQLRLLLETSASAHSDFYSYRYFASEGFLPGYNFPRLPLSAFLPGRRQKQGTDEFLTRPRFLAISEFGPRSIIYHEGSRYVINKVILPVEADEHSTSVKRRAIHCGVCGYIHPLQDEPGPDLCERCGSGHCRRRWTTCFGCRTSPRAVATASTRTKRSGSDWASSSRPACVSQSAAGSSPLGKPRSLPPTAARLRRCSTGTEPRSGA
jgi:ATP-dependent helicase YprA (DUF1998 family)/predicted nuclease of restriction endonuclease-like (RecB) superfamily